MKKWTRPKGIFRRIPKDKRERFEGRTSYTRIDFASMADCDVISFVLHSEQFKRYLLTTFRNLDYNSISLFLQRTLNYVDKKAFADTVRLYHKAFRAQGFESKSFFNYIFTYLQEVDGDIKFYEVHLFEEKEETYHQFYFPSPFVLPVDSWSYSLARSFFYIEPSEWSLSCSYSLSLASLRKKLKRIYEEGISPQCLT